MQVYEEDPDQEGDNTVDPELTGHAETNIKASDQSSARGMKVFSFEYFWFLLIYCEFLLHKLSLCFITICIYILV